MYLSMYLWGQNVVVTCADAQRHVCGELGVATDNTRTLSFDLLHRLLIVGAHFGREVHASELLREVQGGFLADSN